MSSPVRPLLLRHIRCHRPRRIMYSDLAIGQVAGIEFRVAPLRRSNESAETKRARLLYQSRKRGTLESDLVLSTFAKAHLASMPDDLLAQYDALLDENDWDLYYWATQRDDEPRPQQDEMVRQPAGGEWAQTVGTVRPAYRPVPQRWRGSRILDMLREHVRQSGGMAFMPELEAARGGEGR